MCEDLFVVVDDASNFLGVSSKSGHHLLRGVLKDNGSLIGSSSEGSRRVSRYVQAQDSWDTGTVQTLGRGGERESMVWCEVFE